MNGIWRALCAFEERGTSPRSDKDFILHFNVIRNRNR
jgi:hypothetical protein